MLGTSAQNRFGAVIPQCFLRAVETFPQMMDAVAVREKLEGQFREAEALTATIRAKLAEIADG